MWSGGGAGILLAAALALSVAQAKEPPPANRQIDFQGFAALTADLGPYREARRLTHAEFEAMAKAPGALTLDARSASAYAQGHIAGAVNLPFTDFTDESLARVIGPDRQRPILIYCNNNFANDAAPVPVKSVRLALNIPTFINLYGYGYPNIYELADIVDFNDPAVRWTTGGKGR
ncbi:MAG: rhodanese-like domain-containing protein [Hyphomonadaceae bacterium]|nr:rhodanese-like domain-containing protein [Hyphomonadaceae bacterium]